MFLLTDSYPPFSLDDVEYPARPILPDRGPLNRVSVFFRIILAVPAAVFYEIVQYGLTFPLLLVMWFVVLITGRMPPALYDAYSALLRYQVRFHAWFAMLTSEYAWGMLGDIAPPPAFAAPPPAFAPPPFVALRRRPRPAAGFPPAPPYLHRRPGAADPGDPGAHAVLLPTTPGEQVPTPEPDAAARPSEPELGTTVGPAAGTDGRRPPRAPPPDGRQRNRRPPRRRTRPAPCPRPRRGSASAPCLRGRRCRRGGRSSSRVPPAAGWSSPSSGGRSCSSVRTSPRTSRRTTGTTMGRSTVERRRRPARPRRRPGRQRRPLRGGHRPPSTDHRR